MEQQPGFAEVEYQAKKRVTRRERFLTDMEKLLPWRSLVEAITPFYPKGERGRPPMGIEKMLRIYFLQQWYALADEALEDALYDSLALRAFTGLTKKGNAWHFGMKAHIGVDLHSGVVHSLTGTAANVADIAETHHLLHGQEKNVLADAGYQGVEKRAEIQAKFPQVNWLVARKRSKVKKMTEGRLKELTQAVEKQKAQLRAFVEHPFHVVKNLFRYRKVRYRGLAKNTTQLYSLFALANLVIARPYLRAVGRP